MTIPEQAVEAAARALTDSGVLHDVQSALILGPRRGIGGVTPGAIIRALTAAAPYMSASAREQALEEAAGLCETSAKATQELLDREQDRAVCAALIGGVAASNILASLIRSLKSQPKPQTGGGNE